MVVPQPFDQSRDSFVPNLFQAISSSGPDIFVIVFELLDELRDLVFHIA